MQAGSCTCRAAAVALSAADGWRPDVLHCHDWHTALVPVLQRLEPRSTAPSVLTLHNVGYQGVFADEVLDEHGFAALEQVLPADARAGGGTNFLRAGLRAARSRHDREPDVRRGDSARPEFGMGLEDVLRARGRDLVGILNGVDYGVWSPDQRPVSGASTTTRRTSRRNAASRSSSLERLELAPDNRRSAGRRREPPRRAERHRPLDARCCRRCCRTRARPSPCSATATRRSPASCAASPTLIRDRVSFTEGYDEALAHEIFAGSDLTVVPSRYEPCGLTQMYALRYGTIPVVRATGGLADTIQHFDAATGTATAACFATPTRKACCGASTRRSAGSTTAPPGRTSSATRWRPTSPGRSRCPHYEELYRSLL